MSKDFQLSPLLSKWAASEPQRCRQQPDQHRFEVLYASHWLPVTDEPAHHGTIIAALLEACHQNQIYCQIEYTPRYEDEEPTIQVGCTHGAFLWDEGEAVIETIPAFLLTEYLEHLQLKKAK